MIPHPKYCVDNGVMVAWTGVERLQEGLWEDPPSSVEKAKYFIEVRPRWPLGIRDGQSQNLKEQISQKMKKRNEENPDFVGKRAAKKQRVLISSSE